MLALVSCGGNTPTPSSDASSRSSSQQSEQSTRSSDSEQSTQFSDSEQSTQFSDSEESTHSSSSEESAHSSESSSSSESTTSSSSEEEAIHADGIEISPTSLLLDTGETYQLHLSISPAEATDPVTWAVESGSDVASVSQTGVITPIKAGRCVITATVDSPLIVSASDRTVSCLVEVQDGADETYNLYLDPESNTYWFVGFRKPIAGNVLVIPSLYKGKPVTRITSVVRSMAWNSDYTVNYWDPLETIRVPSSIQFIEDGAFFRAEDKRIEYDGTRREFLSLLEGWCPDNVVCKDGTLSDNLVGPEIPDYESMLVDGLYFYNNGGQIWLNYVDVTSSPEKIHFPATYNGTPVYLGWSFHFEKGGEWVEGCESIRRIEINCSDDLKHGLNLPNLETIEIGYNRHGCVTNPMPTHLDSISVDPLNPHYAVEGKKLLSADKKTVHFCFEEGQVTLPSSVEKITDWAFAYSGVTEIDLSGIREMGEYAFSNCYDLSSVTLPAGMKTIAGGAFDNCVSLRSCSLPAGLEEIQYGAFDGTGLRSIVLPEGLLKIDGSAFMGAPLSHIEFPSTLKSIGEGAFSGTFLRELSLPDSVEKIGDGAFEACHCLQRINHLPADLKTIPSSCFSICDALVSVSLPAGIETIGDYAFSYCRSLSDISFPQGLRYLDDYAFYDCSSLTSVSLPDSLLAIGRWTFDGCGKLEKLTIPASVGEIGPGAFGGRTEVTLADGNEIYVEENGLIYNFMKNRLIHCDIAKAEEVLVLPSTVQMINNGAFVDHSYSYEASFMARFHGNHAAEIASACELAGWTVYDYSGEYRIMDPSGSLKLFVEDASYFPGVVGLPLTSVNFDIAGMDFFLPEYPSGDGYAVRDCVLALFEHCGLAIDDVPGVFDIPESECYFCGPTGGSGSRVLTDTALKAIVLPKGLRYVDQYAFQIANANIGVFYAGSPEEWQNVLGHENHAKVKCYSASARSGCWRYVEGVPTVW